MVGYKKSTFPIRMILKETPIEFRTGWTHPDYEVNLHKVGKHWKASDVYSGAAITVQDTRDLCLAWIDEHRAEIEERKSQPIYAQWVREFKELLEKEKEKLEIGGEK